MEVDEHMQADSINLKEGEQVKFFDYDKNINNVEYYEILEDLMERWEHEIVEFKEAKGGYDTDKIGRYFSAISNEANLRNQQYGWLVFGVSEKDKVKHVVGTAYKKGDKSLLEKFKYEIARDTTNGMTFYDIIELLPSLSRNFWIFIFPPISVDRNPSSTAWFALLRKRRLMAQSNRI